MPQTPTGLALGQKSGSTSNAPLPLTADGKALLVESQGEVAPVLTRLNISAATVVKAAPGKVIGFTVVVAGAAGSINDCLTTGAAAAANEIGVTPAVVGYYPLPFPCAVGITVTPGAAQVIALVYQ